MIERNDLKNKTVDRVIETPKEEKEKSSDKNTKKNKD